MNVLSDWRTWGPLAGWVVVVAAAMQILLHNVFMGLPMVLYHIVAGCLQGVLILCPAVFYVMWRAAAERERQALEDLQEVEQMRKDLVAMLVHDMSQPISSAGLMLDLLLREKRAQGEWGADERQRLASAHEQVKRLQQMVANMLEIAAAEERSVSLELQRVDLRALIEQAVTDATPQAEYRGVSLTQQCSDVPKIEADPEKVRRVLGNLLSNALDFTPEGGCITVSLSADEEKATVAVTDTGEGLSEELVERVFDRYTQLRGAERDVDASVGLGLAFCKLVVEAHEGRIWADSSEPGGTRFSFTLPLSE